MKCACGRGFRRQQQLCKNVLHHTPMHVGEPKIAASIAVGEALVIEAEEVEYGCVQIVHMHRMLSDIDAELIRTAISHSTFDAAAREQHREGGVVMISADL